MPLSRAIVRAVPASFDQALTTHRPSSPIDVARAQAQHQSYVAALASLGLEVTLLAADESTPDCCFVEDTCVVVDDIALVTRPGAPSRRTEVSAVAEAVARHLPVVAMEAPATLEGGDCLRTRSTLYVGLSARTNPAGVARLRALAEPRGIAVVAVPLPPGVLHLKSVCSRLGDDLVLVAAGALPAGTFAGARTLAVPADEHHAANAVAVGGTAIVAAGARRTRVLLEAASIATIEVDTSELGKADGALTCLSILL